MNARGPFRWRIGGLVLLVGLAILLEIGAGRIWILPGFGPLPPDQIWILTTLRLPRALLAVAIGASLGLAGAVAQGYTRNPLADPSLLGVGACAALGAVLALFLGAADQSLMVFAMAMAGAGGGVLLLGLIAGRAADPTILILAGTVIATLAGALTSLLISIAPNPYVMGELLNWLMGALTDRGWNDLGLATPPIIIGMIMLAATGRALDALTLGPDVAATLGVRGGWLQTLFILGLALSMGAGVAAAGVIGFIGLIVPHLMRPLFGARPSALLLPCALAGGALLPAADALVRLMPATGEIRLGVILAMAGAPFFLWVLLTGRKRP